MARHCRLCYGTGHNRRTCPNSTLAERTSKQTVVTSTRNGSRCSYCLKQKRQIDRTHNVRNCPRRREDAVVWTKGNTPFAEKLVKELPKYGIGVGAIVRKSYDQDNFYVVTKVNWDNMSINSVHGAFSAAPLTAIDHESSWNWRGFELPNIEGIPETLYSDTVVVNPVSAKEIVNSIPDDFKFGYYGMPDKLREKPRKRRRR